MNPALIGKLAAGFALVSIVMGLYFHGKKVASLEGRVVTAAVVSEIGGKQDEVLLNGPDDAALTDILLRGAY